MSFSQPINEFHILVKAFGYFRTHWWLFALEVLAVYSLSLIQYKQTQPVFVSDGSLLIDTSRRQLYQSMMMSNYMSSSANARKQNMAHLLTGQEVMERFRNHFSDYYNEESRPAYLRSFFPAGVAYSANAFKQFIVVNWDRNSDVYNFRCTSHDPAAAHDMCLTFMNTIQSYYPEIGQRESLMKRDFLRRQSKTFVSQIGERESELTEFQRDNEEFFNYIMLNPDEKTFQRLRTDRSQIQQKLATNRAILHLIMSIPHARRGEHSARTPAIGSLTTRVSELEYQMRLTENSEHPDKESRINTLKKELVAARERLAFLNDEDVAVFMKNPIASSDVRKRVAELELEYRTEGIRLQNVEKEIDSLMAKEKLFGSQRMAYDRLLTELNHKRKLLTNLYQKEQEADLELSAGNAEVFRLQEPTRNGFPIAPVLSKHLYASFSLSAFIVVITAVLLIAFFPRLDNESEVHRLHLPVLGKVPLLKKQADGFDEIPPYGLEFLKIMNYRIIRETKDVKCPVIIISSPHAREGKSTVTNFLTLASRSPGRKCLLIDGDLLTSHPNKFYGIPEDYSPGLKAVLDNKEFRLDALVVKTMHEGVYFLPRGDRLDPSLMPNIVKPLEKLLGAIRQEFDVIYIDTPPLFASNLAHQWAGLGDLIVLVARMYATRPKDIAEAIQTCKIFSKSPVGISLNCVSITGPSKRASNYYFSRRKTKPPTPMAA